MGYVLLLNAQISMHEKKIEVIKTKIIFVFVENIVNQPLVQVLPFIHYINNR